MPSTAPIELIVLGSGTCALQENRSMAGYSVRHSDFSLLLDCGDGVLRRCLEAGLTPLTIDAILFSHLHLDHIADAAPLLWSLRHAPGLKREKPLWLFGPSGVEEYFNKLRGVYGEWLHKFPFPLQIREVRQEEFAVGPWQVKTLPMRHGETANGYRLQSGDKVIAYSGDTGECAEVVELGDHADLLILECSFAHDPGVESHLYAAQAGRIARQAACKKLLLTHFYPECDGNDVLALCRKEFSGAVELASDLMRVIL